MKFLKLNDDKSPMTKFDITFDTLDNLRNAGLILNSKIVVIDFDNDNKNEQQIVDYLDKNYNTLKITSTRGVHLYYSLPQGITIKNGADKITTGGFQVDYKTGDKSYTIVKFKGNLRKTNYPLTEETLNNLPTLPNILLPLSKAKNISGYIEGEGRNNALYCHLLLVREQYSYLDIKDIADFINNNIFTAKLKKGELVSLIESALKKELNEFNNYNDMISFAKYLADKMSVKRYREATYFKINDRYKKNEELLQIEVNRIKPIKKCHFSELTHQLINYAERIDENVDFRVQLKNGIIDGDKVIDLTGEFTPFYLDIEYKKDAYDKNVDNFLNFISSNKEDMRNVLEEIIGHTLMVKYFPYHLFFLTGNGANGKSTFANMLTYFVQDLSAHIDIEDFNDATCISQFRDKLLNVSDDIDSTYINKVKNLKSLASGEIINPRPIYNQPIMLKNTATLLFTTNEVPEFKDKTGGMKRRIMIIPFENEIKEKNPKLIELLATDNAKSYILNLGLNGISRIIANGYKISDSQSIREELNKYYIKTDSVTSFVNEVNDIANKSKNEVYMKYEKFCEENDITPVNDKIFTSRIKTLGYKVEPRIRQGVSVRMIIKK